VIASSFQNLFQESKGTRFHITDQCAVREWMWSFCTIVLYYIILIYY